MAKPRGLPVVDLLRLVRRHLRAELGWRWLPFLLGLVPRLRGYARRFARPSDGPAARTIKRKFLLLGAIHHRLVPRIGADRANARTTELTRELVMLVQQHAYEPPRGVPKSWRTFHEAHEAQMRSGMLSLQEHDEIRDDGTIYQFHITKCRWHETFRDMELPELTELFCRSDEIVYNQYSPQIRFHRGRDAKNTIARGANRCTFIFERTGSQPE